MPITKPPAVGIVRGVRSGVAGGGGGGPTTFVSDTFTDANATTLASHTGETGATWTQHPAATSTMQIRSNNLRAVASTGLYYASGVPASADYSVAAPVVFVSDNGSSVIGAAGRLATGADTKYWWRYLTTTDGWELLRTVAAASASLGTFADASPNGKTGTLVMVGNQISLQIDGVTRIGPVTDNNIAAAGRVGVYGAGTSGDAVGVHLASIQAI